MNAITMTRVLLDATRVPATFGATGIRPAFEGRLKRFLRLDAALRAFKVEVYDPLRLRWLDLKDQIPHTTAVLGTGLTGRPIVASTADESHVRMARRAVKEPFACPIYQAGMLKIAEAADARERALEKGGEECGFAAAEIRAERLGSLVCEAEEHFVRMPVKTAAELEMKVSFMVEHRLIESTPESNVLFADVRALAAATAAPAPDTSEWDRLMSEMRAGRADLGRLTEVLSEAEDRYFDALPARPKAPDDGIPGIENMTIAQIKASPLFAGPGWTRYQKQLDEWSAVDEAARGSSGFAEAQAAYDRVLERVYQLRAALLSYRSPDPSFVFEKLRLIGKVFDDVPDGSEMEFLLADVDRLAAGMRRSEIVELQTERKEA